MRVETNVSDFVLRACLLQKYSKVWHPVVYYSWKMTPLKLNYNIYNKQLLEVVIALKKQRAFLQSIKELFVIKTDYKNFTIFFNNKGVKQKINLINGNACRIPFQNKAC